jgi:hypothetical protein
MEYGVVYNAPQYFREKQSLFLYSVFWTLITQARVASIGLIMQELTVLQFW